MGLGLQPLRAQVTTAVEWQRCIGGTDNDWGLDLAATSDGGFICFGNSYSADGDAVGSHGDVDMLVTKIDADGVVQWTRVLGGSGMEWAFSCIEASDGSILVAGITSSNDGQVTGNHGQQDIWVVKLSALGTILWQRAYGGSAGEGAGYIQESADGGFLIHGNTQSLDGDVVGYHPGAPLATDCWIFKIDGAGQLLWSRAVGGSGDEATGKLVQTMDGGILLGLTYTGSTDGDLVSNNGAWDCALVKLDAIGNVLWSLAVGGSQVDEGADVIELVNGDIVLLGRTTSDDGDLTINQGGNDVLLAKVSSSGTLVWSRTYGGSLDDQGKHLFVAPDGNYIVGCDTKSNDGDISGSKGELDAWVLKVDVNGALVWQRCFGGSFTEHVSMSEAEIGGYILTGYTNSNTDDVQGNHGSGDLWFAKLTADGALEWQRCSGGSSLEFGFMFAQTADGGYVMLGQTDSNDGDVAGKHGGNDMWVLKLRITAPEPRECALFIPNAFSPDKNSTNDAHCIHGTDCVTSMTFHIFDRWGNKVFESTDPNACWDGTYNGQPLDPAVFVYHLSATLNNSERVERQGNITLMR
jgi:gliding motility-associated-like protein